MNRRSVRLAWLLVLVVPIADAYSMPGGGGGGRGGGGGGGRGGGGGGMRGGGGGAMRGGGGGRPGGGGASRSPSFSAPRPSPRPSPGGGARPGAGSGARPGAGAGRPSNLPAGSRPGARPGGSPGAGPGIGNRPGVGQPGVGQPGIGNRPGIGDRPGVGDRPGGGRDVINNRPITGGDRTINRGDVGVSGIRQGNLAGARVDPGYGVRAPGSDAWRGAYGDYHRGWVNGYWHGYHTNPSWNWGSFAVGAFTGVAGWGLGSSIYSWGYAPYSNPYYEEAAAPVVVAQPVEGQPLVAYDYSQPIDAQAPPPEPSVADQATATFDSARAAFKAGNYAQALDLNAQALSAMPNDATLHEFRALCLFALQKYDQAATPLYAVLSVGPGWDWTTLVGLYPSVDVYTQQLRALEAYVNANPKSSASRFVLAYHYLTQDHPDAALRMLREVVALTPNDTLSPQLIQQISGGTKEAEAPKAKPAEPPTAAPVKEGKLVGEPG